MPQVDTHLLASRDGYKTFASTPSVTPLELRELEELVYGQPDDASVYAALTTQATAMLRRLRSTGRYALSRIIHGDRDSAGRETIAVCTIILTAAQYQSVARGDLWRLLHSPQLWSVDLFRSGQPLALPEMIPVRRAITSSDVTLFDAWMAARSRQNAVAMVGANPASHQAVIALLQVLAEKDLSELTWGCRLFSLPSSISVASIAQKGVEQNSRRIIVIPATSPTTTYGQRSLAFVGTNGYLTSVIEPATIVAKAPQYLAERFSLEEVAPSQAPKRQRGKQSTYTGGESKRAHFQDPLAHLTPRKTIFYLVAGVLALGVFVGAFWLVSQFQSSREVTAQKIIAQDAANDAQSSKEKAVSAKTPEESKTFADDAEKSAVKSRAAADSAARAHKNSGFFGVSNENDDAQKAADNAKACADLAKNAVREQAQALIVTSQKNIAIEQAKLAEEAENNAKLAPFGESNTFVQNAEDAANAAEMAVAAAKDANAKAGKAVQNLDDAEKAAEQARLAAQRAIAAEQARLAAEQARLAAEQARLAAEQADNTDTKQGDSTSSKSPPENTSPPAQDSWKTKNYIVQLKESLEKLGKSKTENVQSIINELYLIIGKMGEYTFEAINKEVFVGDNTRKAEEYNELLFILKWTNEVLKNSDSTAQDNLDKFHITWVKLTNVGPDGPKTTNLDRPKRTDVQGIEDFFDHLSTATITDSVMETHEEKIFNGPDRCTLHYNIPVKCLKITGAPIKLDDLLNGKSFIEMPFYSVVLIFHEQFEKLFDLRIQWARNKKSTHDLERQEKNKNKASPPENTRVGEEFPWYKLFTDTDSKALAVIDKCNLLKLINVSEKIRELDQLCNGTKNPH